MAKIKITGTEELLKALRETSSMFDSLVRDAVKQEASRSFVVPPKTIQMRQRTDGVWVMQRNRFHATEAD